jgi:hypothetical protein
MSQPIDPAIKEKILHRIKHEGVIAAHAAKEFGVLPRTVYGWLSRETDKEPEILEVNRLKRELSQAYELIGRLSSVVDKQKKGKS